MMRRAILAVAGLMIAASLSWMPAAQAARPEPCLVSYPDFDTMGGGVLEVPSGSWLHFTGAQIVRTPEIREEFLLKSFDSLSLDGRALTYGYTYSDVWMEAGSDIFNGQPVQWDAGWYPMVSIEYLFSPLKPGVHTLVHEWYLTEPWSDGWYPVMPAGWSFGGNVTIVVTPRTQYPSGQYENLCRTA